MDELAEMGRLVDQYPSPVVVLTGLAGVGKTALATYWAHSVKDRFTDGQLYVDLAGFSSTEPIDPSEALGAFLRALGVAPQRVPVAFAERVALYRTVTADLRLLVVLDNAYSAAQVRPLVPASGSVVLVTSRSRLVGLVPDGARLVEVAPLSSDASVDLLVRVVGPDRIAREREPARHLAGVCGGLPIALCVAAGWLIARPRLSVRAVVTDLADEGSRLASLSGWDGPSVQAALDQSYQSLPPAAAALYRRLALHPGPEFGLGAIDVLVAGAVHSDGPSCDPVDRLVKASLLEEVTEGRFRFHDLIRLHARGRVDSDDTEADRRAALLVMLEYYLAAASRADMVLTPYRRRIPYNFTVEFSNLPLFDDRAEALRWLELERVNLVRAGRAAIDAGLAELAWFLADVKWPLFLYHKHYRDRLEVDRRGVRAARLWGNAWAEADMLKRLSRACTKHGAFDEAERHARAAIERFRQANDTRGVLDAQEGLAILYRDIGRPAEAVEMFTQLLAGNRAQGDPRAIALTCINLAAMLTRAGRTVEALSLLVEAQSRFGGMVEADPYNGARVLIGLAEVHLESGDMDSAERAAAEAETRMRHLGSDHERAEALGLLGRVAESRGRPALALRLYRDALGIFDRLGSSRRADLVRHVERLDAAAGHAPEDAGSGAEQAVDSPPHVQATGNLAQQQLRYRRRPGEHADDRAGPVGDDQFAGRAGDDR
ncbi:tetratricopeptide repeat protein [Polymorphospora rubra]|uniref:tetratricopeptide repeat protein n=1 Tax=Polymorphospora rubra TaxID=338584 RepID=UPI0033D73D9E